MNRKDIKIGRTYYYIQMKDYGIRSFYKVECVEVNSKGLYSLYSRYKLISRYVGFTFAELNSIISLSPNNMYINFKTAINKIRRASDVGDNMFSVKRRDYDLIKALFTQAELEES